MGVQKALSSCPPHSLLASTSPSPCKLEDSEPSRVYWRGLQGTGDSAKVTQGLRSEQGRNPGIRSPHTAWGFTTPFPPGFSLPVLRWGWTAPGSRRGRGGGWGSQVPRETTPSGGCRKDRPGWSGEQAQQTDPHWRGISRGREQDDPIQERARRPRGAEGGVRGSCPAEAGGRGRRPRCRAGPSSWQVCSCPLG